MDDGCGLWRVGRWVGRLTEGVSRVMGRLCWSVFFLSFLRDFSFCEEWERRWMGAPEKTCGTEREMKPTYKIQGTGKAKREERQ